MKYSEFYKLIEAAGWTISKGKKHHKYVHPDFDYFIPVGRHPSKEIPKGTLESMMKDAGLKKVKVLPLPSGSGFNWTKPQKICCMKTIVAIIEKAEDGGYGIYTKSVQGAYGYGLTEQEAKNDFVDVLNEQAEFYKEKKGVFPEWYTENISIDYKYDFSGFFKTFPFFNVSQFAQAVGINPSLMRKYKEGLAFASEKQKAAIQDKFNEIVTKMSLVQF